ncbi:adhesion G-protein coupled receptor G2 isoform X2 [Chelmon rostratus]|uniref:adhesion G-protein coupled receptor G2 isoform X2 n=1 Tax=Chelmon rostratus TaxID=109905 RepID=UPI001BEA4414|nr:adhesion G-protein coupled receptor G2 isoform X2 [Chelmon rostratus]
MCDTMSGSMCRDSEISKRYQGAHLECHGTQQRLYSCMVILEMSGPVDGCSLNELLQQLIDSNPGITNERPLTRMVVCGPPGLPVHTLLTSNLTWVASDLLTSDVCQADPSLLPCEANEMLAVLLTDSCPPTTQPSTVTSSSIPTTPGASPPSATTTAVQTYTTAETTAALQQTTASQGTTQQTTQLTTINGAQSSAAPPVLHTSSQHMTVTLSGSTTAQNTALSNYTTLPTPVKSTNLPNRTTAQQSTTEFTLSSASSISQITTAARIDSTTLSPNHTTMYKVTTADTFTPSPNDTTHYNITTADNRSLRNGTFTTSNATVSTFTPSPNHITEYKVTTAGSYTKQHNSTITSTNTTVSTFTPSPNHTAVINVATVTKDYTTEYNGTTADNNRNRRNATTTTANTTMSTFTPSPSHAAVYDLTTVSNSYTTAENVITTTVSPTTATDNVTTSPVRETQQSTTVPYKTTKSDGQTLNATTSTTNSTVDATEATVAPQTGRVTHSITATNENDTNSTTAATGVSPVILHNQTAGISVNSSSTAPVNLTTRGSEVSLTTGAAATSTTRPPPVQISTTTAEVSLTSSTTSTFTTTTTTNPETTKSQEAQEELANQLLNQTQDASQLNSSQVEQVAQQLEKLLDGPTVSQAVGQRAIGIISNLMEGDSQALSASANRLIRVVDDLGLKLVVAGDREVVSSNSLVLAVRTVDGTNFSETSVDIFNTDNVQLRALSRSWFKRSGPALGSVFLPSSLTSCLSPEQQQQASRVQFTFYTKSTLFQDATLDNRTLVSPVLGSSVANLSISNLSENIQFTIRNINPIHANNTSCAFWDFTLNGGGGGWSSAGCFLVNATPEDTTCSCNHLTSFAILLDLSREELNDHQQAQILTFITYIGCGISAIFLAVTLLTYLSFEKLLRDIPAKILVQLCMSLLLLNLVFLLDGWLALYPAVGLCISTAFFLHYFLLTSFTWAGLEALHMYLSVIQVFTPYLSRYMLRFSLMGWGIPLIVVIVVISVDKDNYGLVTYGKYTDGSSDDFCWLRNDIAFYVGVVAYFILIFALCLLVFIMVMVQLARIKKQNPQNQSPNRGVLTDLRSIVGLIILLGLTWGFALFAWGPLYLPFIYLFSIFNTLQGFLIFVFHCAVKENVRRQWRTYLCCGRLRLAENSDWSRTATHNNRNMSVATATTSAPQFTSRSSSVISDGTNSSGSVFADSGISDGSNSDVVLNEIHRRNLLL